MGSPQMKGWQLCRREAQRCTANRKDNLPRSDRKPPVLFDDNTAVHFYSKSLVRCRTLPKRVD